MQMSALFTWCEEALIEFLVGLRSAHAKVSTVFTIVNDSPILGMTHKLKSVRSDVWVLPLLTLS